MNNYRIISDIGSGAYSTVHKAIDVSTGHIVAIKKISDQNMNIKHIINREVTFLHESINHPNIIQLYKCFSLGSFTYLVFEFMPMDLISYYKSVQ
jgi:serine/threonine protein kinase